MDPNNNQPNNQAAGSPNPSGNVHQNPSGNNVFAPGQNVQTVPGQVETSEKVVSIPTTGTATENVRPGHSELEQQQEQQQKGGRRPNRGRKTPGVQSIWTLIAIIFLTAILFATIGGGVMYVNQQSKVNILENDNDVLTKRNEQLELEVLTGGEPNILVTISELGVDYIYNSDFNDVQYALDGNRIELGSKLLIEETRKAGGNDAQAAACSAGHAGTGFIYRLNKSDVLQDDNEKDPALVDTVSDVTKGIEDGLVRDLGDFYVILNQPQTFCSDTVDAETYNSQFAETVSNQRSAFLQALRPSAGGN